MSENLNSMSIEQIGKYFFATDRLGPPDYSNSRRGRWRNYYSRNDDDYQQYQQITPEKIDKVLTFFEKKGAIKAYNTLFEWAFDHWKISRERFIYACTHNLINYQNLDIDKMSRAYSGEGDRHQTAQDFYDLKNFFLKLKNKRAYKKVVNYIFEHNYADALLDNEVIKGLININTIKSDYRVEMFRETNKPRILYRMIQDKSAFLFSAFEIMSNEDKNFLILVKLSHPDINNMLLSGDPNLVHKVCEKILYENVSMRAYIKRYFCLAISRLIDNTDKLEFPLNLPMFYSCSEKFKKHANFDYVTKPDEWGQRRFKLGHKWGVIDATTNKVIVKATYTSIGAPAGGVRKAIGGTWGNDLVYLNKSGEQLVPSRQD